MQVNETLNAKVIPKNENIETFTSANDIKIKDDSNLMGNTTIYVVVSTILIFIIYKLCKKYKLYLMIIFF